MNSIHDLGGMDGMGPILREDEEPVFHAEWEGRVAGIFFATICAGLFNDDEFRQARERLAPHRYLTATYYEHWLLAMHRLFDEKGLLSGGRPSTALTPAEVLREIEKGATSHVAEPEFRPRFNVGDRVVARNLNPPDHTRLPRYVRGREGTIDRVRGVYALPDTNANGKGRNLQYVYSVRFTLQALWGPHGNPDDRLYIDLWDDYLDRA